MSRYKYAEVVINNKSREMNKIFHYAIPEEMTDEALLGRRVIVSFGRSNKKLEGYIVGLTEVTSIKSERIKPISKLLDEAPVFSEQMIQLIKWLRDEYLCSYIDAIHTVLPAAVRIKSKYIIQLCADSEQIVLPESLKNETVAELIEYLENSGGKAELSELKDYCGDDRFDFYLKKLIESSIVEKEQTLKNKVNIIIDRFFYATEKKEEISERAKKQKEVYEIILKTPGISMQQLKSEAGSCDAIVRALIKNEYVSVIEKEYFRNIGDNVLVGEKHKLTDLQIKAINEIKECFNNDKNVLLHGVTGSGKTEIYLELMEEALNNGKEAILMVPEISLTAQMINRVKNRFGENVAVLHSGLSEAEKYDEWRKINQGLVKVAVGARSAVFAPFENLGIIIIDEEHENTFKSEMKPKYLTGKVAEKRCKICGAKLLLGSATPLIETYYRAKTGDLGLVSLLSRINGKPMPNIEVVDMREELKNGNKTIFSAALTTEIEKTIKDNNQIILFLNRRGHSTFVSCRQCGLVMKCPNCSISLTYHMKDDRLTCHYCGFTTKNPQNCPKCQSKNIKYFGVGTQKLEKEFITRFKIENILRMDADTTSRKNSHNNILDSFRSRRSQVLLGTQMISKGLDFPDVTLVGVITADTTLNMPDFRSAEKTFQMIAQVAGRSGRAEKEGKVVVQTYNPDHYSIIYAQKHDYTGFFEQEIKLRKELHNPPFSKIASIIMSGENEQSVIKKSSEIADFIKNIIKEKEKIELLGPTSSPLGRIKNRYRWQLTIKGDNEGELKEILLNILQSKLIEGNFVNVSMDLNPNNML